MYQSRIKDKKGRYSRHQKKRDLDFPDDTLGTHFAVVKDMLGNGRVRVLCEDGSLKIGRIRGSMRKSRGKTIIDKNDLVIVSDRGFDDKIDIVHKYTADEVSQIMKECDALPEKILKSLTESEFCRMEGTEDTIVFCEDVSNGTDSEREHTENDVRYDAGIHIGNEDDEDIDIDNI